MIYCNGANHEAPTYLLPVLIIAPASTTTVRKRLDHLSFCLFVRELRPTFNNNLGGMVKKGKGRKGNPRRKCISSRIVVNNNNNNQQQQDSSQQGEEEAGPNHGEEYRTE